MKKIQGELLELSIALDKKTISKILNDFRRKGKIKKGLNVFFIIYLKTREIIQYALTANPGREFVRQQFIEFSYELDQRVYLIHDRSPELCCIGYPDYGITEIATSIGAPNMNAFSEQFVGTARREVLDNFILFGKSQIEYILAEYVFYYNTKRLHQGLAQNVPKEYEVQSE